MTSHNFDKTKRLRHKAEFDAVYQQHGGRVQRSSDALFTVLARFNSHSLARLGLSISSRAIPTAVGRNRIKRLTRESFRLQELLPAVDVVVNARSAAAKASNDAIALSLTQHWQTLRRKCAGS